MAVQNCSTGRDFIEADFRSLSPGSAALCLLSGSIRSTDGEHRVSRIENEDENEHGDEERH